MKKYEINISSEYCASIDKFVYIKRKYELINCIGSFQQKHLNNVSCSYNINCCEHNCDLLNRFNNF